MNEYIGRNRAIDLFLDSRLTNLLGELEAINHGEVCNCPTCVTSAVNTWNKAILETVSKQYSSFLTAKASVDHGKGEVLLPSYYYIRYPSK